MRFTYKKLLRLDSLQKFLSQGERITCIKMILNQEGTPTDRIEKGIALINKYNWEPPEVKIGQDRLERFYNSENESWQLTDDYEHPILTEIQKIK